MCKVVQELFPVADCGGVESKCKIVFKDRVVARVDNWVDSLEDLIGSYHCFSEFFLFVLVDNLK